jgi:hypothetical protein
MFIIQKELFNQPSFHYVSGFIARRQTSISPMPNIPYTPNRAA